MTVPNEPEASRPRPSGTDRFSPTGGDATARWRTARAVLRDAAAGRRRGGRCSGGDTPLTPRVQAIARRYAPVDVALLSVNGLRTEGQPVVMPSEEAAVFAGMLRAKVAIPTHYAFRGGRETEGILSYNGTAERFLVHLRRMAPGTRGRILEPGQLQRFVARRSR